jgi:hypothetical protein
MDANISRPEDLILRYIPVPPVSIRPPVGSDNASGWYNTLLSYSYYSLPLTRQEDDLTVCLLRILSLNYKIETEFVKVVAFPLSHPNSLGRNTGRRYHGGHGKVGQSPVTCGYVHKF